MDSFALTPAQPLSNTAELFAQASKDAAKRRRTKTPTKSLKKRQGKGGKTFTYVDRAYVEQWLDEHFPTWSFEVVPASVHNVGNHIHVAGTLTVVSKEGLIRRITRYGAKEAIPNSAGNLVEHPYLKSAESDCIKRCAAALGCAFDVYGNDFVEETNTDGLALANPADLRWFCSQLSSLIRTIPDDKVHNLPKQFLALQQCKLTKQQIIANYAKLNIALQE